MSTLIRKTWKVEGVLTDVTSMVLSDPTGTYGIKRNDTGATVTAADTAMTKSATGTYDYTFDQVDGVAYTAYIKVVYLGATYYFERDIAAEVAEAPLPGESLSITYTELQERVARYLGLASSGWRDDETLDVEAIISSGVRQFYWPPGVQPPTQDPKKPAPVVTRPYEWSFLRQAGALTLDAGTATYDLPSNFNLLVGKFTCAGIRPIKLVDEGYMRALQGRSTAAGAPVYAAIADGTFDATLGSAKQVSFAPTPDKTYSLGYRYSIVPDAISEVNLYPLGGAEHGETILQSCLAMAELKLHDQQGPHYQRFMERLSASMRLDMQGGQV